MPLCVVSSDEPLRDLCNALVASADCEIVHVSQPNQQWPGSNVCLWDFETAGCPKADSISSAMHCVILVERKNFANLRGWIDDLSVSILLKPVSVQLLRPFVELAFPREPVDSSLAGRRPGRDALLQCLLEANLEIQNFDHMRTNFLARALHDFRAPLTALNGYCRLLLSGHAGHLNTNQSKLIGRMKHSLIRITRMVSGMFELSVRHQIQPELDFQHAKIQDCIEQAVHEIKPLADEKNIAVLVCTEASNPNLAFEPGKIEQVLINLLENACKFTPRFGTIQISGYTVFWDPQTDPRPQYSKAVGSSNAYRIDVRDSGAGIASDCLESIFEEYTSYSGGADRSGGGLGLAISRMIVAQHRGTIWAQPSQAGACLSFVLPDIHSETDTGTEADCAPCALASRAGSNS